MTHLLLIVSINFRHLADSIQNTASLHHFPLSNAFSYRKITKKCMIRFLVFTQKTLKESISAFVIRLTCVICLAIISPFNVNSSPGKSGSESGENQIITFFVVYFRNPKCIMEAYLHWYCRSVQLLIITFSNGTSRRWATALMIR